MAVIAFTLAIGSAFASMFTATTVFVKAKTSSAIDAPTVCINTAKQCESSGTLACTIQVPVSTGPNTVSTSTNYRPFSLSNCTVQLNHDAAGSQTSTVTGIYRLVGEDE